MAKTAASRKHARGAARLAAKRSKAEAEQEATEATEDDEPATKTSRGAGAKPAKKAGAAGRGKSAKSAKGKGDDVNLWSDKVTKESDALDLEKDVFNKENPVEVARSLKESAEQSERRKSSPYRSAMSMLVFYISTPRPLHPVA